jgi:hypothetical protein
MREWLVVVVALGCDAGAKKAPPPAPMPAAAADAAPADAAGADAFDEYAFIPRRYPKETLGWLKGTATDAQTHEPVQGVYVEAPVDSDGWAPSALTDDDGRYKLYYPEGQHTVSVKLYTEEAAFQRQVTIKRGKTTTLDLQIAHTEVLKDREAQEQVERDAAREKAARACPPPKPGETPAATADIPALVGSLLRYYATHPKEMMDWPDRGNVFVLGDVTVDGAVHHLDPASLRPLAPKRFIIRTKAQIQAEADQHETRVMYVYFNAIELERTCALVEWRITLMLPTKLQRGGGVECCSGATDRFHKGASWTRVARLSSIAF